MKRCFVGVILRAILILAAFGGVAAAQSDGVVPDCTGNSATDTASIVTIVSTLGTTNPATLRFPHKMCAVSDVTVPANVSVDLTGGYVRIESGKSFTVKGQIVAPAETQIFFNALPGQGTVTFSKPTVVHPEWWGARSNDDVEDTQAFQAAAKSLSGGVVKISPGTFLITSTITLMQDSVQLVGSGLYTSIILCNPPTEMPCIDIKAPAAGGMISFVGVRDLGMLSTSLVTKHAIRITDGTEVFVENVRLNGFTSRNKQSTGLQLRGRQLQTFRNVTVNADRPISIEDDPNTIYDVDHYHFENLYLVADLQQPCISVGTGVNLSNVTIDGYQSWVQCKHGFYYNDSTTKNISFALTIKNARWEQNVDDTGYFVYVSHNSNLDGIILENLYGGGVHGRGLYFRKAHKVTLTNFQYQGALEVLNADATDTDFVILNPAWPNGKFNINTFGSYTSLPADVFRRQ